MIYLLAIIGAYSVFSFIWVMCWMFHWMRQEQMGSGVVESVSTFFPVLWIWGIIIWMQRFKPPCKHRRVRDHKNLGCTLCDDCGEITGVLP